MQAVPDSLLLFPSSFSPCMEMPSSEPWTNRPGFNRPNYTPFDTLKELCCCVSDSICQFCHRICHINHCKCSFTFSIHGSDEIPPSIRSEEPPSVQSIAYVQHPGYRPFYSEPRVVNADPSPRDSSQSPSGLSASSRLNDLPPSLPSDPPRIDMVFERFTLRSIIQSMPPRISRSWHVSNRSSQVSGGNMESHLSSSINLDAVSSGSPRPTSPDSRISGLATLQSRQGTSSNCSATSLSPPSSSKDFDPVFRPKRPPFLARYRRHFSPLSWNVSNNNGLSDPPLDSLN